MKLIDSELTYKNIERHKVIGSECGNEEISERMAGYNPTAFIEGFRYGLELAMELVSNQPVAYDPDKVVEQLEDKSYRASLNAFQLSFVRDPDPTIVCERSFGKFLAYKEAIEVVRNK